MFMSQACQRGMHRADEDIEITAFQLQHFHVAESLGNDRVARIEVGKLHGQRARRSGVRGSRKKARLRSDRFLRKWKFDHRLSSDFSSHEISLPGSIS